MIDSMNSAKLDVRMTIEGKDFAMIEDFVQTLVNLMIDAGTDETIKHLKDSCEKQQVEKKIIKYLNQQKKYNGLYSVAEEYDFAGICNYLKENSFQKVLDAISGNDSQRKAARSELYTGAYHAAHAETAQSKEKVRRLVSETVDILREIQHSKILLSDRVMQAEIVDDVNAHTDKAIEAFAKKAQENNQSPFSPENVNKAKLKCTVRDFEKVKQAVDYLKAHSLNTAEDLNHAIDSLNQTAAPLRRQLKQNENRMRAIAQIKDAAAVHAKLKPIHDTFIKKNFKLTKGSTSH